MAAAAMVACGQSEQAGGGDCGDMDDVEPTLTSLQANLFEPSCAYVGCHAGSSPKASLDLSTLQASQASLINTMAMTTDSARLLVVPGSPEDSYLMNKLTGVGLETNTEFPDAESMPAAGDELCDTAVDQVALWIVDGCPL